MTTVQHGPETAEEKHLRGVGILQAEETETQAQWRERFGSQGKIQYSSLALLARW